ncbi:hypothetical protein [Desulfonatronospira sp. MSAO_Bac3]|uniref:hypothetical protein n=1 Tax=Desulfonatronospira sp. MSAO_Bac3 TaxID=2293857 RepID=UPI000FEF25E8|nr:hypothetical protein [Desulfonatronospira sp. MSAO_Bac3]RQD78459.1 MAG: hypothetical protein D5S03_02400 [Desulfonatronospira sp. MSAO_Bac3]
MINLGLTQDLDSCPIIFARLGFALPAHEKSSGPLLRSWPGEHGQLWELFFPLQKDQDHTSWVLELSACIKGLRQTRWCVNTHDLVQVFNLPLDRSLASWGDLFWPHFRMDSVFVFATGNDDHLVREVLDSWHRRETNICLRSHYDFTVQETSPPVKNRPPRIQWDLWHRLGVRKGA